MKLSGRVFFGIIAPLSFSLIAGCASSEPHPAEGKRDAPAPHAGRFVVPAPTQLNYAEEWIGRYEGTGDAYTRQAGRWQQQERLVLILMSTRLNALRIKGSPSSSGGWDFVFDIELDGAGVLNGEKLISDGTAKYEYSFARSDDEITGVIKRHQRESHSDPFPPPDEWIFKVRRAPAVAPH